MSCPIHRLRPGLPEIIPNMAHLPVDAGLASPVLTAQLNDLLTCIEGMQAQRTTEFFKCLLREKAWFQLSEWALEDGLELVEEQFSAATFVEVAFHVEEKEAYSGCGGTKLDRRAGAVATIGYASGRRMTAGVIPADLPMQLVRYDRTRECFTVNGVKVFGADAIILGKDCIALVIGPRFTP